MNIWIEREEKYLKFPQKIEERIGKFASSVWSFELTESEF